MGQIELENKLIKDLGVQSIIDHPSKEVRRRVDFLKVKYPRTFHLPWSPGVSRDDRVMKDDATFYGEEVVVLVKMDGENTTMYHDGIHARSIDYGPHPSRDRVKALHASIAHDIPPGWRICGENVFAKHSIHYRNLPHFFLVFSIWNEENVCLPWDETVEWANLLGLKTCPVWWRGMYDRDHLMRLYQPRFDGDECEGYVVRVARSFHYSEFTKYVGKYVRKDHVNTQAFWRNQPVVPNTFRTN